MTSHSERGWFNAAMAVASLGHSVIVHDPEALDHIEVLWDGDLSHGEVTVISVPSLAHWQLMVTEELPLAEDLADALSR